MENTWIKKFNAVVVVAAARGIVSKTNQTLLAKNGGHVKQGLGKESDGEDGLCEEKGNNKQE